MTDEMREHKCPNCGAPLGIPQEHERYFKCQFCGTTLEDRASKEEQQTGTFNIRVLQEQISAAQQAALKVYTAPPVITSFSSGYSTDYSTDYPTTTNVGNRVGCIITTVILLFVGGILFFTIVPTLVATGALVGFFEAIGIDNPSIPFVEDIGTATLQFYNFGPLAMLPSDNDTTPDFVTVAGAADQTNRLIYIDLENDPGLRWMATVTGDDATYVYNRFVSDETRLYFSYASTLMAFNRQQGTLVWEAAVSDEIQHNICFDCLQLFGDTLVTLSASGTLEAWNTETGARKWEVRLNATPRQIVNFGGNPAVLDDPDGPVNFYVYSLTTGGLVDQFAPACPNPSFPESPEIIGIYDKILARPDGTGAYFFTGVFGGCAQYWTPGSEEAAWTSVYDADIGFSSDMDAFLLTDTRIYIAISGGAYAIDLANGAFSVIHEDADYNFAPLGARDGVLVLRAERTRGTTRLEVWGVDAALGNVKWTYLPQADQYFDSESSPLYEDGFWTAALTTGGLTVVQMFAEPARAVFQTIPLQSGTASEPVTFAFSTELGGHWTSVLGWRGNQFWVTESTNVFVVDVTNGQAVGRWP
jgi:outer membrane protein assembly factor BamB